MNGVKEFRNMRELLGYLGKNTEDRKLVYRMIKEGKVRKEDGMYYIVEKDEEYNGINIQQIVMELEEWKNKYKELEDSYKELEADYIKWIQEHPAGRGVDKKSVAHTTDELSDLDFQIQENDRLYDNRDTALRKCYEFMVGKKIFNPETNPYAAFFEWATGEAYEG